MTKNIMMSLGFGDSYKAQGSNQDATSAEAAALSGSFGTVTTETNGFLVSFNGQMGEFAIRTQTAFQGILQTIQSAANSIPSIMPSFSFGGSGAGSGSGGFEYNSSTGYNWWNSLPSFSGGGAISSDGVITGPGTGTSDSILAALSNGEFVINAKAVQQIGVNALHSINSGQAFQLSLPRFAMGGLVGSEGGVARVGAQSAAAGMSSFGANLSASVSPEITIRNTFNGEGFGKWVTSQIDEGYKRNMRDQAKVQSMLMKKFR